jgi:hypothetical protein
LSSISNYRIYVTLRDNLSSSNTSDKTNGIKNIDNIAQGIMEKFQFKELGVNRIIHINGTNTIYLDLSDKKNLSEIIKRIQNIKEIDNFLFFSNMIQEVYDALSEHDNFKAFVLSCTVFETIAKEILINYFNKKKLFIEDRKIRRLGLQSVIFTLYTHKLIDHATYLEIISINKLRVKYVHFTLSQVVRKEDFQKIDQSVPKIKSSIEKLQKLYTDSLYNKGEIGIVNGRTYNGIRELD